MRSIRARLLALSLSALAAVGLITVWLAYRGALHEIDELMDAQLAQYARIMLALAHEAEHDEVKPPDIEGHTYASRLMFQIWHREHDIDRLLLRSPEAPTDWPAAAPRSGYGQLHLGDTAWRVFVAGSDDKVVLAALDLGIRDELARDLALGNLKPYLVGLPLLGLLLFFVIRSGLRPLSSLRQELARRSPEQLDAIVDADAPRELAPLIGALNRLFERVAGTLANERRFTSDAAHELRTPLAALRMQLQVAQRTPDDDERIEAIAKALRGGERMTHLVAQLLALARLEGQGAGIERIPISLSDLVRDSAGEFSDEATRKGIDLGQAIAPDIVLPGNADLLRILLRNLLDNALRYVPAGGHVRLSLARDAEGATLSVADDGPGVATGDRARLGERFNRLGPQTTEGVGLGLSIVRRIVELHGGRVEFGAGIDGRGLEVRVRLPSCD